MDILEKNFEKIRSELDKTNTIREKILNLSRQSIRKSSIAIKHLHRGELKLANQLITENHQLLGEINKLSIDMKPIRFGMLLTSNQEYVESVFLQAFLEKKPFPNFEDLGVPYLAYLHGLTDFVGELRRVILDTLRQDKNIEIAITALDLMDDLYSLLLSIDYPDSLTFNLRKKTDFVRNITEKTRGDVTLAINRLQLIDTFTDIVSKKNDR
ncbi:MAG: haloacid dehalogenase [Candidatus Heimdallarchaeota archaeon]|nr:haloacid dehalogenase [Candidatus Heimdallarchaeota archaeon]